MLGSIITCAVFLEILPSSWNLAGWLGIPKLIYVIMKTFKNTKLCSFIVTAWMIIKLAIIYPTSVLVPPKMDGSLFMRHLSLYRQNWMEICSCDDVCTSIT